MSAALDKDCSQNCIARDFGVKIEGWQLALPM